MLNVDKEIKISGCIDVSENPVTLDEFSEKFIEWIEINGWFFGGGINLYVDNKTLE